MRKLMLNLPIYTFHIDFSGHVSNLVYIQWLEICRLGLLEAAGLPVSEAAKLGVLPVLTETHITYHKALYLGDTARAEAWISELGGATAWVEYRITNGAGELCASAKQRGVFIHAGTRRPARFSLEQRAMFQEFMDSVGEGEAAP